MLPRLGNVLYWLGIVVAIPLVGLGIYGLIYGLIRDTNPLPAVLVGLVPGVLAFILGRALRYVLAGR